MSLSWLSPDVHWSCPAGVSFRCPADDRWSHRLVSLHFSSKRLRSDKLLRSGWGNGFNTATTPLWVAELVPPTSRGRHVAIQANLIAFGIVIAYYFNIALSYTSGPVQWRTPIAAQGLLILAQVFWVYNLPESSRWLIKRMCSFFKIKNAIGLIAD